MAGWSVSLLLEVAVAFLIAYVGYHVVKYWIFVRKFKNFPTSKVHPFFGNTPSKDVKPLTMMVQIYDGMGKIFQKEGMVLLWILHQPLIILFKAETLEALLNNNKLINKSDDYSFLKRFLKDGLLLSSGLKWKKRRKMLTSSFHFRTLERFQPVIDDCCSRYMAQIDQMLPVSNHVPINGLANDLTLDIVTESVMGLKLQHGKGEVQEYKEALAQTAECFLRRVQRVWLWPEIIYKYTNEGAKYRKATEVLNDFGRKVISNKKEILLKRGESIVETENGEVFLKNGPLLDLLLHHHMSDPAFTEEDVLEEVNNFMFAGPDTTSANIMLTLYMLGLYKDMQDKVYKEIEQIIGTNRSRPITLEDIKQMIYLEQVIKEALRLFPPATITGRKITEDFKIGDRIVPEGTTVWTYYPALHRDPDVFKEPEVFDPERFSVENSRGRNPMAYIPFAAGSRNCIGQKLANMILKTTIAHFIRAFHIEALQPRDKVKLVNEIVLKPADELNLKFTARS